MEIRVTKPTDMLSDYDEVLELTSKIDKALKQEQKDLMIYTIAIDVGYYTAICKEVEKAYIGAGWRHVECLCKSGCKGKPYTKVTLYV